MAQADYAQPWQLQLRPSYILRLKPPSVEAAWPIAAVEVPGGCSPASQEHLCLAWVGLGPALPSCTGPRIIHARAAKNAPPGFLQFRASAGLYYNHHII